MKPTCFILIFGISLFIPAISIAEHNTAESLKRRIAAVGSINIMTAEEAAAESSRAAQIPANAGAADGATVYNNSCVACHATGVAGAPKTGDVAAWTSRVEQGIATLVEHAVNGFQGQTGVMPAKGGNAALSEAEVAAAVKHMLDAL